MHFEDLNLHPLILKALEKQGYTTPTPIQAKAIPPGLEGRDILGCAQTGTGKTAAFALPILQRLASTPKSQGSRRIRALILAPTRELASQIAESFEDYGCFLGLTHTVVFGGVRQRIQTQALDRGVDILVATPGRLLDLFSQGILDFRSIEVFVLDEADRMLDMGFINDIRRIARALPEKRQTMLFSATLPKDILNLAGGILTDPVKVSVAPSGKTVEAIDQSVYFVKKAEKIPLLIHLLESLEVTRALVFSRTKRGADKIARHLGTAGIRAVAIHGNKDQKDRERALEAFKNGKAPVLVATDIASRGLDIDDITHVINYDLPDEPECYVHRVGRTGRAGAGGKALSFCGEEEFLSFQAIERLIKKCLTIETDHPFPSGTAVAVAAASNGDAPRRSFGSLQPAAISAPSLLNPRSMVVPRNSRSRRRYR